MLKIFIRPPHVWGSPEQIVDIAYKVLQNFEISSARPGASVGDQAVVLVAQRHMARALAALERTGMRAVKDSAFRYRELPQSIRPGEKDGQPDISERKRAVARRATQEQLDLPLSFRPCVA
jgi:hypothetical protein